MPEIEVYRGGTGPGGALGSPGAAGNTLRSNGSVWGAAADPVPIFHIEDYGPVVFGFTGDNSTTILAAIAAATAYTVTAGRTGAIVQLPVGVIPLAAGNTLTISDRTWLRGAGLGLTELYCLWGTNSSPIIHLTSTAEAARVGDFSIATNTTTSPSATAHGILLDNQTAFFSSGGDYTLIENMLLFNIPGHGIQMSGFEQRIVNVAARTNANGAGSGFNVLGTDNMLSLCTADTCAAAGFNVAGANNKLTICKAFGGAASGFNIGGQRGMFSACEAQDNANYGFNDAGGDNVFSACVADTNGQGGGTSYGFLLTGGSAAAACLAINRSGTPQTYGFKGVANAGLTPNIQGTSILPGTADVDPASVGTISVNGPAGGGGLPSNFATKTANYTALPGDYVEANPTGGPFTVTLPAAPVTGALVAVKNVDSTSSGNTLTIAPSGGGTIDGQASVTTTTQYAGAVFEHKGSNVWRITASMSTTGPQGAQGNAGGNSFAYTFDTGTSDADPGAGKLRINNAAPASATVIYIDQVNYSAASISAWLTALATPFGTLKLFNNSAPQNYAVYTLTGVTNAAPYFKLAVTFVAGNGTLGTIAGDLVITYSVTGATGPTGSTGSTGATGATGAPGSSSLATFADASDGTLTFDGSTTILGMAPSSSVYTMTRDIYLATGTINNGVTVKTVGYRIFCRGTLTNNGTIHNNGAAASTFNGGQGGPAQSLAGANHGGFLGGTGTSTTGANGSNSTTSGGGAGGAGGVNGGSANTFGTGGTITAMSAPGSSLHALPSAMTGYALVTNTVTPFQGGGGGGAGAGDGTQKGGGGGGGGGPVGVYAFAIAGTGAIQARGGNGGAGVAGNAGGGGGGGGGWIVVISSSVSGGAISGQTIDANAGALGALSGSGSNGVAGNNGLVVLMAN